MNFQESMIGRSLQKIVQMVSEQMLMVNIFGDIARLIGITHLIGLVVNQFKLLPREKLEGGISTA